MEVFFLILLILLMAGALASGFPVAFALPGSAILAIALAALTGWLVEGNPDAYFVHGGPVNWLRAGVTNFRGIYWEIERDTLIAIPLFVFMGIMLQRSKIAEDLLVSMAQLFGPIRGGLGISVVFVGALLAATTGIVGATVVAMGLISLPAMLRNKYSHSLATGTIAASGTLGQIIPPSIVLIILADQLSSAVDQAGAARTALYKETTGEFSMPSEFGVISTSAGDMFMGALVPGLVLVGLYMLFIFVLAFLRPKMAPSVPSEGAYDRAFAIRVVLALVPPLTLIFVVLGSIITGVATVNQAGAIGAAGALIMAGYRLRDGHPRAYFPAIIAIFSVVAIVVVARLNPVNIRTLSGNADTIALIVSLAAVAALIVSLIWSGWRAYKIDNTLRGVMIETAKTTSLVFIILLGAAMLTSAFRAFGGEELVKDFLTGLPGGFWTQFFIVMLVIFILGFFLDFIEIAVVVVPIVAPILLLNPEANITAVWLGVMIGLNIQTSFLTPPFGFALFYLRGVAPAIVTTLQMYKGVVPFISLQLLALVIVGLVPPLVNYVPNRVSLTAETAPPPKNPRLQYCVEQYVGEQFATRGDEIRGAIATARQLDVSMLPEKLKRELNKAFQDAEKTFTAFDTAVAKSAAVDEAAVDYAPLHHRVRDIQRDIRDHDEKIAEAETTLRQLQPGEPNLAEKQARYQARIAQLQAEKVDLAASIPADWDPRHKAFVEVVKAEKAAQNLYRRTADSAYDPIPKAIGIIQDADGLEAARGDLLRLKTDLTELQGKAAEDAIRDVSTILGRLGETNDIRQPLSDASRAFRGSGPSDLTAAMALIDQSISRLDDEVAWRKQAQVEILPGLQRYESAIADTIGLRQQARMPRSVALDVAACTAHHRDVSLYF